MSRRNSVLLALAAILALVLTSATSPRPAHLKPTLTAANGSWTVYHHDDAHTGFDSSLPGGLTGAVAGWTSATLDGGIYASPLIFNGVVYTATLNDTVYALDQATGNVLWSKNVGAPQTGGWICGNVTAGILSTPVIDTAANRIYVVAELASAMPTYHAFGLDLANKGNIVLDTPISPAGFDWKIEQQRGALAVRNGYLYVPIGGRAGDCYDNNGTTPYHGYVAGVPTNGSTTIAVYVTPDVEDGIWAAGGIVVDDSNGHVFAVTGNGGCPSSYNYNDAVIRFNNADLSDNPVDYFAPEDWHDNWSCNDQDLGSASPVLINSNLMFAAGKWGGGFLLNPNNLGGIDGQLFPTPKPQTYSQAEVCFGNHLDATFGSFAYAAPYVYLECEGGHGIVALSVNTANNTFSPCDAACAAPDWHAGNGLDFGPPIVAGGAVWAVSSGNGLYAFNASTGAQVFHSAGFGIHRFVTPAEAGGQVFVPANDDTIRSFNMTFLPWTSLGGIFTSEPDASAWSASRVDVFGRGQDNGLWQNTFNGSSWSGWGPLGGIITSDPGAVSWSSNRIDVFARGQDGALYHRYFDGTRWAGWDGLGGGLVYGPDVASWAPQRLDIFIVGLDHALWHKYWGGAGWSGWESLGGYLTSSPTAVSWSANRIDIFARGGDLQMWHLAWANGWSGWQPMGGQFSTGAEATSCASGHLDVFALGVDQSLWRNGWNGAGWSGWQPLGSQWTSDPATVCVPGTTSIRLFERGADSAIWTASVTGT